MCDYLQLEDEAELSLYDEDASPLIIHRPSKGRHHQTSSAQSSTGLEGTHTSEDVTPVRKRKNHDPLSPWHETTLNLKKLKINFESPRRSVIDAVEKSCEDSQLIGDFSRTCVLPTTTSCHADIKSITPDTLRALIQGQHESISNFTIVDCRYPYEYNGGHISGAVNIYTKQDCEKLLEKSTNGTGTILIFHCEFSKERGPNLCRHLRQHDRQKNEQNYPRLDYPEVYILEGGYKNFFGRFPELCEPMGYTTMLHPDHKQELLLCRKESKTWNSDCRPSKNIQKHRAIRRGFKMEEFSPY